MKPKFKRFPKEQLIEHYKSTTVKVGDYTSDEGPYIISKPMTDMEIRIEIAKVCGWTQCQWNGAYDTLKGVPPVRPSLFQDIPDYLTDLNAMHVTEKEIPLSKRERYWDELGKICQHRYFTEANIKVGPTCCISATAIQRAKAFLITFDIWK